MISMFSTEAGEPRMRQSLVAPAIYMDHWAIRKFSEDLSLRDRFLAALNRSGGTLLLSLHNFGEFSGMTDEQQAAAAELFFDLALPRLFVADFGGDPGFMQRHGRPTEDGKRENLILREMADRWLGNGNRLTMVGLVGDSVENRAIVNRALQDLQVSVAQTVNSLKIDPAKVALAKSDKRAQGATLRDLVMNALLRDFVVDAAAVFGPHDASDFVHAMGAAMSCELVLLDGRWAHKMNQADRRLRKMGVTHRLPRAFAPRELSQFLDAIEAMPLDNGEQKVKTIPW
ncbi:hypothetical protein ABIC94_002597 [Variovorax paradoxus]|uniref:hypothetical protein n=1 Tax=Variovorax paradoxus TaxID=34073 RepID=UPI0033957884